MWQKKGKIASKKTKNTEINRPPLYFAKQKWLFSAMINSMSYAKS